MRFVTQTRLEHLQRLIRSMANAGDGDIQKEALHILESLKRDIEENYAEIRRPVRLFEKAMADRET
jgi:hypothetical protein